MNANRCRHKSGNQGSNTLGRRFQTQHSPAWFSRHARQFLPLKDESLVRNLLFNSSSLNLRGIYNLYLKKTYSIANRFPWAYGRPFHKLTNRKIHRLATRRYCTHSTQNLEQVEVKVKLYWSGCIVTKLRICETLPPPCIWRKSHLSISTLIQRSLWLSWELKLYT